jgi:RHS repeat-associated protein
VVDVFSGVVAQALEYDPFGKITSDTNPGFQPFAFAGGIYDPDTGLTHFGAREYDPETGSFTRPDPSGFAGGENRYAYAGGDPVNFVDPDGNFIQAVIIGAAVAGAEGGVPRVRRERGWTSARPRPGRLGLRCDASGGEERGSCGGDYRGHCWWRSCDGRRRRRRQGGRRAREEQADLGPGREGSPFDVQTRTGRCDLQLHDVRAEP